MWLELYGPMNPGHDLKLPSHLFVSFGPAHSWFGTSKKGAFVLLIASTFLISAVTDLILNQPEQVEGLTSENSNLV